MSQLKENILSIKNLAGYTVGIILGVALYKSFKIVKNKICNSINKADFWLSLIKVPNARHLEFASNSEKLLKIDKEISVLVKQFKELEKDIQPSWVALKVKRICEIISPLCNSNNFLSGIIFPIKNVLMNYLKKSITKLEANAEQMKEVRQKVSELNEELNVCVKKSDIIFRKMTKNKLLINSKDTASEEKTEKPEIKEDNTHCARVKFVRVRKTQISL